MAAPWRTALDQLRRAQLPWRARPVVPLSARVLPPIPVDERIHAIRERAARAYFESGSHGVEVGAGARPHRLPEDVTCRYVDRRDAAGLSELFGVTIDYPIIAPEAVPARFPDGADFLIAHNVLEHVHDPIGVLVAWNGWLRDGGLGIISLPEQSHCLPDSGRMAPDAFHLLCDYLFERGPDAFESRDHIPGFLVGWQAHIHPEKTRAEYCRHCLDETKRDAHDLHWHALDRDACDTIVAAASAFGRRRIELLAVCSPSEGEVRTLGEIIYVYRVHDRGSPSERNRHSPLDERAERALAEALSVLDRAVSSVDGALAALRAGGGAGADGPRA